MNEPVNPDQNSPADGQPHKDVVSGEQSPKERPGRRMLLDLGPLVVFFAVNYMTGDFMLAVKVLVGTTIVALTAGWILERRVSMMALVGCVAVAFFGGLSVYFDNDLFIKIKPTVLTCLLAAVIAGGRLIVASTDGMLRSFAAEDVALLSSVPIAGGATTRPVVAEGTLYVVSGKGVLHAYR